MALTITPLDAPLGALVEGLDFAEALTDEAHAMLQAAVDEHLALVFRNGDRAPTDAQVVAFCGRFGTLKPSLADKSHLPGFPGINRVSNRNADGVQGTGGNGCVTWHSDLSFTAPLIEMLWLDAQAITSHGGETRWTNLCAAYEALPATDRALVDGLGVRYRLRDGLDFSGYFKATDPDKLFVETEISLVQTNPRSGRKALWPNIGPDFAAQVVGYEPAASDALLRDLFAHCTQERFVYSHDWRVGDAALWLNNQTMHQREAFPDDEVRVLRHVNILGISDPRQLQAA